MAFRRTWSWLIFLLAFPVAQASGAEALLDADRISAIVGVPATTKPDGVVRVSWPRTDVPVHVDGLALRAAMGLGTWAAFQRRPEGAMVMGDTVVFEDEVNPALDAVLAAGLEVTALHNHFFFDDPKVYFMHIGGRGGVEDVATGVRRVWDAVRTVREHAPRPRSTFSERVPTYGQLDTGALERIIGASGNLQEDVFKISIGRDAETQGVPFGGSMGLSTWMAFAGSDGFAAVDGDFAMTAREVQPVLRALRKGGIHIVALHNHMIDKAPDIYFVHFWGKGAPAELAQRLLSALDAQRRAGDLSPVRASVQGLPSKVSPPLLVSAKVTREPTLDGVASDEGWKAAAPLRLLATRPLPPDKWASVSVEVRSVHTDSGIYFLVTWADSTESVSHKTWTWNAERGIYEQGDDREDMFALAFQHTGPFDADMLSGAEAVWDVWHWKALRTNPQGYATDKTHHYTRAKPEGKAKSYEASSGEEVWIARPEDVGDSVEKKQPAPDGFIGQRVVQYLPSQPSDSAADVRAKGRWSRGVWILEFSRRLDTGHPDDTAFEPGRRYKMALVPFNHTGDMDKASEVIELWIAQGMVADPFEGTGPTLRPSGSGPR